MTLTDAEKKIRRKVANAKYRAKKRQELNTKAREYHDANKERRNARRRELYAQRKAQRLAVAQTEEITG